MTAETGAAVGDGQELSEETGIRSLSGRPMPPVPRTTPEPGAGPSGVASGIDLTGPEVPEVPAAFWRESAVARVASLRIELASVPDADALAGDPKGTVRRGVLSHLAAAEHAATSRRRRRDRLWAWWVGAQMDRAWLNIHHAEILLASLLSDGQVRERIPDVLAHLKVMDGTDARRSACEKRLSQVTEDSPACGADGRLPPTIRADYRAALRWAYAYGDEQYHRLRSFRNSLVIATVIMYAVVTVIILTGLWRPPWVPLCFNPAAANQTGDLVCPTGTFRPDAGVHGAADVAVVALFGLVGAVLSAVGTVRSGGTPRDALSLRLTQAMLKLPIGALVAIVGILFIQGEFIPGLSVLDTPQQIIAYAVVLGASQHIVTRLIDRQSQTLLDRTPSNDLSRPPVVDEARATDPARPGSTR